MNGPFFILGNPRSGTTLLRLMLNSHPLITVPPECGFMLWLSKKYSLVNFNDPNNIEEFLRDVIKSKKFETWNIDLNKLQSFIKCRKPKSFQEICSIIYFYYGFLNNKRSIIIGDKNNFYLNYIDEIKDLFPKSKLILLVRDGRDVACSYRALQGKNLKSIYAPKLPYKIVDIASEWSANNRLLINLITASNPLLVRYEELLLNPIKELSRMCIFLGVPYDNSMLNYHHVENQNEPMEFLGWKEKTLAPIDRDNINKFQLLLSKHEIAQFDNIAGAELDFFGYKRENLND